MTPLRAGGAPTAAAARGYPTAAAASPPVVLDRESGPVARQWFWHGPGPVDEPGTPFTPYDEEQNTAIEFAYRAYRKSGGAASARITIMGDTHGVKSDGEAPAGHKHATYGIDFFKMAQVNTATGYERALRVMDLKPGQRPWRDPRKGGLGLDDHSALGLAPGTAFGVPPPPTALYPLKTPPQPARRQQEEEEPPFCGCFWA